MLEPVFILGGQDSQQCEELRDLFQEKIPALRLPRVSRGARSGSPSVGVSPTGGGGRAVRTLPTIAPRVEDHAKRAALLGELIRLFASSPPLTEMLERVAASSTTVLGESAFIVLKAEVKTRLEEAYLADRERFVKALANPVEIAPEGVADHLIAKVLHEGTAVVIPDLAHSPAAAAIKPFIDKHKLRSFIGAPIRSKDRILGAFVTMSIAPRMLTEQDLPAASEVAEFTGMALDNAGLVAELQRSAITDGLTGVYNTRFFHEILGREAARADRYNSPLSLLMIDVDCFKQVNDTFGHLVGDKVLTQIGGTIAKTVRNTDFVFRCGGDEFGVVLPGTAVDGAKFAADKILERVENGGILENLGYNGSITVSIGVSEYRRGSHFETLVAEADQALYASKRSTRNCVRVFIRES